MLTIFASLVIVLSVLVISVCTGILVRACWKNTKAVWDKHWEFLDDIS